MVASSGFAFVLLLLSGLVYWLGTSVLDLGAAQTQTLLFAWFIFAGSQGVIYLARARGHFWAKPRPARLVNIIGLANLGVFSLMAIEGWLMASVPWYLLAGMLLLAAAFLVGTDLAKTGVVRLSARSPGKAMPDRVPAH